MLCGDDAGKEMTKFRTKNRNGKKPQRAAIINIGDVHDSASSYGWDKLKKKQSAKLHGCRISCQRQSILRFDGKKAVNHHKYTLKHIQTSQWMPSHTTMNYVVMKRYYKVECADNSGEPETSNRLQFQAYALNDGVRANRHGVA